jgi:hypothetical protein
MNMLKIIVVVAVFFSTATMVNAETDDYQTALEAAKYRQEQLLSDQVKDSTDPTEKAQAERNLEIYRNMPEDIKSDLIKHIYREAAKQ